MRLIFRVRSISWLFRKGWYSLYRWKNPTYCNNEMSKMIDIGMFTIGYAIKSRRV